MKGMGRWLGAPFTGGGAILAVNLSCLTSSCFFCALSSAFSSPLSSASAPSSWWPFHFIVIPSTPSSALPLPSQACPFTSSSSECQNTNDLTASEGLWVSSGHLKLTQLIYLLCFVFFLFCKFSCKSPLPETPPVGNSKA